MRAALPLPRLEVRRGGQGGRPLVRTGGREIAAHHAHPRLSGAGSGRLRLGVAGRSRKSRSVRPAGLGQGPGRQDRDHEDPRRLQLGAGAGRRNRFGPFQQPPFHQHAHRAGCQQLDRDRQRLAAPLCRQVAPAGGGAHPLRLPLCRDPQADPQSRTPGLRAHHPVRRTVFGDDPPDRPLSAQPDAGAGR